MARPSKLTPETQKKIVDAIAAGNYYEAAAAYAGVDYRTFRYWMEKGEAATSGKYFQFFHTVRQAEAQAEVRMVAEWQRHAPNNWQAIRDFLARRHPDRWMPKTATDITTGGQALTFVVRYAEKPEDDGAGDNPTTPTQEAA